MQRRFIGLITLILTAHCFAAATTQSMDSLYKPDRGNWPVKMLDQTWHDPTRNRDVPVRIYLPQSESPVKLPVIVFSHGWGASRFTYGYFCQHLASNGYLVVSPTHLGSDTGSIKFAGGLIGGAQSIVEQGKRPIERLRDRINASTTKSADNAEKKMSLVQSIEDPDNLRNRPADVSFVLDELARNADTKALADLTRVGVAGHSFGAYTAMVEGGMLVDLPEGQKRPLRDARVKAVLPMSPEGRGSMGISNGAWGKFAVPVMFLTGTKDYGTGERSAAWRREAFDSIRNTEAYLVTLEGATHFTFAFPDRDSSPATVPSAGRMPGTEAASPTGRLIDSLGIAFFDAKLTGDAKAKAWLKDYFSVKHSDCTAEAEGG